MYSTAALAALEWIFNGAAFFQSGKWLAVRSPSLPSSTLQWSRFFSKRKMLRQANNLPEPGGNLQWSRFF